MSVSLVHIPYFSEIGTILYQKEEILCDEQIVDETYL